MGNYYSYYTTNELSTTNDKINIDIDETLTVPENDSNINLYDTSTNNDMSINVSMPVPQNTPNESINNSIIEDFSPSKKYLIDYYEVNYVPTEDELIECKNKLKKTTYESYVKQSSVFIPNANDLKEGRNKLKKTMFTFDSNSMYEISQRDKLLNEIKKPHSLRHVPTESTIGNIKRNKLLSDILFTKNTLSSNLRDNDSIIERKNNLRCVFQDGRALSINRARSKKNRSLNDLSNKTTKYNTMY